MEQLEQIKHDEIYLAMAEDEGTQSFLTQVDEHIVERFTPQEKGTILQLGCSTDTLTSGIIDRALGATRLVVVDPRLPLLDAVRFRSGRKYQGRIFFNSKFEWGKLPFDDEVFVSVVSNLFWMDAPDRESFVTDIYRVLHHAGAVLLTAYMRDSFREFFDLYGETLIKFDMLNLIPALQAEQSRLLDEQEATLLMEQHGFSMCRVRTVDIPLTFNGSKQLLGSPLVQGMWLPGWSRIGGEDTDRIIWHLREAVDRYFSDRPLRLTVKIGILTALK